MAAEMARQLLLAFGIIVLAAGPCVSAGNSLIISHAPDYVHFNKDGGQITTSEIGGLISSAFGHSLDKDLKWTGLQQGSLFQRPRANVLVSLEGVQDVNLQHLAKFPVEADEVVVDTPRVANRLQDRPQGQKSFVVDFSEKNVYDVRSQHPQQLGGLPATLHDIRDHIGGEESAFVGLSVGALNMTRDADAAFLGELQVMHEVIVALEKHKDLVKDHVPDLYHFRLGAMNQLREVYGARSQPLLDAHRLLNTFLSRATESFKALYGGHVLVEVVTLPTVDSRSHTRKARSLMQAAPTNPPVAVSKLLGVAADYDKNFVVIFNITLWTLIFLALVVIAVSYAMWTMDPGRDSIIYRMTSQRIKKD